MREIHELVPDTKWQYCPTELSPAEIGTRGATVTRLQHDQLWWQRPELLKLGNAAWPELPKEFKPSEESAIKERNPNLLITDERRANLMAIVDLNRFSCLSKLLRCTARILRFTKNCRRSDRASEAIISAEEMKAARHIWMKAVQMVYRKQNDFEGRTQDLGVQMHEDGLMRCHGRLKNAKLTFDEIHPILLLPASRLTSLIIKQCHDQVGHGGVGRTLAEVRTQYWILRGRQVVKSIIRACRVCKIFTAKSLSAPKADPLPNIRASRTRPSQYTGVDFAGPLYVKQGSEVTKAYIKLFACAITRAVHLELAPDMTAETFMMSLEKFFSAWGVPNLILSDNAATFKSTAMHSKKLKDHPKVQKCLQSNYVTWKFDLCSAPLFSPKFLDHIRYFPPIGDMIRSMFAERVVSSTREIDAGIYQLLSQYPKSIILTVTRRAATFINNIMINNLFPHLPMAEIVMQDEKFTPVHKDMSLVLTQNRNKSLGFENGQIVTVVNVQNNTLLVRHPEGHIFTFYPVTESTDSEIAGTLPSIHAFRGMLLPSQKYRVRGWTKS